MRNIFFLSIAIILFGCNTGNLTFKGKVVNGKISKLYLAELNGGKVTRLDSITNNNGIGDYVFKLNNSGDKKYYAIFIDDYLIPAHELKVATGLYESDIDLEAYLKREELRMHSYNLERNFEKVVIDNYKKGGTARKAYKAKLENCKTETQRQIAKKQYDSERKQVNDEMIAYVTEMARQNPRNEFAFRTMYTYSTQMDVSDVEYVLENTSKEIKKGFYYKLINDKLSASAHLKFGQAAPNFKVPSLGGEDIELRQFKGKVVLLDFWASWCKPCRALTPHLKTIYQKHKKQGLEVISISIDTNAAEWEKAVKEDGMNWINGSSLGGNQCPVAKKYMVSAVPHVYLIDKKGVLRAEKLHGEELEEMIKTLLNE